MNISYDRTACRTAFSSNNLQYLNSSTWDSNSSLTWTDHFTLFGLSSMEVLILIPAVSHLAANRSSVSWMPPPVEANSITSSVKKQRRDSETVQVKARATFPLFCRYLSAASEAPPPPVLTIWFRGYHHDRYQPPCGHN